MCFMQLCIQISTKQAFGFAFVPENLWIQKPLSSSQVLNGMFTPTHLAWLLRLTNWYKYTTEILY